jgi:hypothetical protein
LKKRKKLADIDLEASNNSINQLTEELNQKKSIITDYDNCLLDSQTTFFSKHGDFTGNKVRYKTITRKEKVSCSSKKINDFGDVVEPKCYYREYLETVETSEQKKYNSKYEKEYSKWLQNCSKDKEFASPESIKELQSQIDSLTYNIKQYNVIRSEVKKRITYINSYAVDYIKLIKDLWGITAECTDWHNANQISYNTATDSMTTCQIFHNVIKWGNYKLYLDVCPTADSKLEF